MLAQPKAERDSHSCVVFGIAVFKDKKSWKAKMRAGVF
jgi:hypothetical protein